MQCKQINLGKAICSDSAVDAVEQLIVTGYTVSKACDIVVEQYAANYPDEAPKSAKQLRKKYYEFQNVDKPKKKVTTKKVVRDLVVDNITTTTKNCTNCFAHEAENAALKLRVQELQDTITTLLPYADQVIVLEEKLRQLTDSSFVAESVVENSNGISREKVFDFVKRYGNEIQCTILKKDTLINVDLFKVFIKVREQYKASTPPPAWDKVIVNATGII